MSKRMVGLLVAGAGLALMGCNAGSTAAALVRLEAEMAGARCAHGGIAVLTGLDANSNLVLDDEEVDGQQTKYVCNGAPGGEGGSGPQGDAGTPGAAGLNALSTVTAEPAGANCRYGGVRIDVGVDTDASGTLETSEVTGTRYVCDRASTDAIYFGDLVIRDAADLALLDGIQILAGSLSIESTPTGTLTLPDLRVISGDLRFGGQDGGGVLDAPMAITTASFPELRRVRDVQISSQLGLASVSFAKLERAGSVFVSSNAELATLAMPLLAQASRLSMYSNAKLASLSLPALTRLDDLEIGYNPLLASLATSSLQAVQFYFTVNDNPLLSHCAVLRIAARLARRPLYSFSTSGNDTTPTCTAADFCAPRTIAGVSGTLRQCVAQMDFATAQAVCTGLGTGGNLLWLTSATEWVAIKAAAIDGALGWNSWIGYSDATTEGTWAAVSGSTSFPIASAMDFWSPGEPGGATAENHAELLTDGFVNDLAATELRPFICRAP